MTASSSPALCTTGIGMCVDLLTFTPLPLRFVSSRISADNKTSPIYLTGMKEGSSFSYHFKLHPFRNVNMYMRSLMLSVWLEVICQFEYVIKW